MTMAQTVTDPLLLESCVRDELNVTAPRYLETELSIILSTAVHCMKCEGSIKFFVQLLMLSLCRVMAVLDPLKVTIQNFDKVGHILIY